MRISRETIIRAAKAVGFDGCGVAKATPQPLFASRLRQWIADGCQADMHYMAEHEAMRSDPTQLVEGAQSVISVVLGYKPSRTMQGPRRIAQYAYGEDYHDLVKRKLYQMIEQIREEHPDFDAKPCVDTVPIADKWWAWQCGLGWIGRNTLFLHPEMGSYCYIGELVTTAESDRYDTPMESRCGDCRRCLDACPNRALTTQLDARRCTSYNTIENRAEQLPDGLKQAGYVFGCDCCQSVCPYNQQAATKIEISEERLQQLAQLLEADEESFRRLTRHTPLTRIKYPQWRRNLGK